MEKYIIIKNCKKDVIKTILNDWLVAYGEQLKSRLIFEIAEISPNVFILKIDKSIDDTLFFYLVNYFAYPLDFEETFEVVGYTTITEYKILMNKRVCVFINEQDTEYDNVWLTTEDNETYKFDFGNNFTKIDLENKYKPLDISNLSVKYEQIVFNNKQFLDEKQKKEKKEKPLKKRFKIISTIFFVITALLLFLNHRFQYSPKENYLFVLFCTTIVTTWFIYDYKIFYDIKRTFVCVILSLLSIFFVTNTQDIINTTLALVPLSSIIVMLFANKYLGTKLGRILNGKWDGAFYVLVFALSILISLFIFTILKLLLK